MVARNCENLGVLEQSADAAEDGSSSVSESGYDESSPGHAPQDTSTCFVTQGEDLPDSSSGAGGGVKLPTLLSAVSEKTSGHSQIDTGAASPTRRWNKRHTSPARPKRWWPRLSEAPEGVVDRYLAGELPEPQVAQILQVESKPGSSSATRGGAGGGGAASSRRKTVKLMVGADSPVCRSDGFLSRSGSPLAKQEAGEKLFAGHGRLKSALLSPGGVSSIGGHGNAIAGLEEEYGV